jgi:ketosteroid isomerase-like protein
VAAMSREDVDRIHAAVDAFGRRDAEALLALGVAEDAEFKTLIASVEGGEAGIYRGHDGVRQWMRELDETMDDLGGEVTEVHEVGEGRFLAAGRFFGTGKGSGATFDVPLAWVYILDGGELKRFEAHFDREAALESLGLERWPED